MRIVVVGRGIFGLTAAAELAARGHSVVVVGPRDPAASSEDISRIVRNDYADEFHRVWATEAIDRWAAWHADPPLFHRVGLANLSLGPMEGFVADSHAGIPAARRLDASAITTLLPFLVPGSLRDGYLNPDAGWVDASRALRSLERRCELGGVGIVPERVARIGDGWVGLTDDGLLRCDRIVVAAGAWTPELVPETAGILVPSGQPVLYLRPTRPGRFVDVPVWALDLPSTGLYGFPMRDGVVKVGHHGSGVTRRLHVRTLSDGAVARMRQALRPYVPELAAARLDRSRVCFYCDAPGGRFLVDAVPGRKGVVVAAGGSGHGFKYAPVLGELIAAVVTDQDHPRRAATSWREGVPRGDDARSGPLTDPAR